MTDNVIKFPRRKEETVKVVDTMTLEETGNRIAGDLMNVVHDFFHDETGECIYTDEEYLPLVICLGEVLTAMYMFSQGDDSHPFYEIANDIFGDSSVDKSDELDYTGANVNNEEP